MLKKGLALLLAAVMLFSLSACALPDFLPKLGKASDAAETEESGSKSSSKKDKKDKKKDKNKDAEDGEASGSPEEPETDPTRIPDPATPAEALDFILMDMMETVKTESRSIGMDLSGAFGVPAEFMSLPTYDLSMSYEFDSLTYDDEEDGERSTHQVLDSQFVSLINGTDAMQRFSMSAEGETVDAAAYFTGDSVLVQQADRAEPLVRYLLPQGSGAALSALQPLHRFRAVLSADRPAELAGLNWDAHIQALSRLVTDPAYSIKVENRVVSAGALSTDVVTYVLRLEDDAARTMASEIRDAWMGDIHILTMLLMAENGVTSNKKEGYIYDQLLDVFNGGNLKASVAASAAEGRPAALSYYVESDGGKYLFSAKKLSDGDYSAIWMSTKVNGVSSPTGGGYRFEFENIRSGEDVVTQDNSQIIYTPEGAERLKYVTHSELTETKNGGESRFTYSLQEALEGATTTTESTGVFSHTNKGGVIDAQFSGQMTISEDAEVTVYDFHGTLSADKKESRINIPEFIDASGVTVSDRWGFSDTLSPDSDFETPFDGFEKLGAYQQVLLSIVYMMGS